MPELWCMEKVSSFLCPLYVRGRGRKRERFHGKFSSGPHIYFRAIFFLAENNEAYFFCATRSLFSLYFCETFFDGLSFRGIFVHGWKKNLWLYNFGLIRDPQTVFCLLMKVVKSIFCHHLVCFWKLLFFLIMFMFLSFFIHIFEISNNIYILFFFFLPLFFYIFIPIPFSGRLCLAHTSKWSLILTH